MNSRRKTRKGGGLFSNTPVRYIPILTSDEYDFARYKPAGLVVANRVQTISVVRGFFAKIPGALGGKSTLIQNEMNELTDKAQDELRKAADRKFANVEQIVGFRINVTTVSRGGTDITSDSYLYITATVSGTALIPIDKPIKMSKK